MSELVVPSRFRGPAQSGNGGWTSGAVAALVGAAGPVEVTLRRPPPLDVPLSVDQVDGVTVVARDGVTVAEARRVEAAPEAPGPVSLAVATAAEATYAGLLGHPFPTCFVCGTGRAEGDGLRIFPGMVSSAPAIAAATWTPHASVADDAEPPQATHAATWASLDCVSGWASDIDERPMVLGRMTAVVHELPLVGQTHVVVGRFLATEGRKTLTSSGLYAADGRLLAAASHVWFTIDPDDFN